MFKSINEAAKLYIERDILACDSSLIHDLLYRQNQAVNPITEEFCIDNIENYYDKRVSTLQDFICHHKDTWKVSVYLNDIKKEAVTDLTENELLELADCLDFDAEPEEVYEWYRVNKWIAEKLAAQGECILDNAYGTWWGRAATGQAIELDGTFQAIAASLGIKDE